MNIRIFSKKAFAIGPGAQRGTSEIDSFVTVPGAFQDMPDKYQDDPTFKLAVKSGDITIVDNAAVKHEFESEKHEAVIDDKPHESELEAFYEELKVMNREDTIKTAEKFNLEMNDNEKLGQFKKRIIEAYKLNME